MARLEIDDFAQCDRQLEMLLDRKNVRRIVEAGARKDVEEWRSNITAARHVRTGSMLKNVRPAEYHEFLGGGEMSVYPQGNDGKGVGNAMKAFVINYGRKGRMVKTKRGDNRYIRDRFPGDKFITSKQTETATEQAVKQAMQDESDRIIEEINNG